MILRKAPTNYNPTTLDHERCPNDIHDDLRGRSEGGTESFLDWDTLIARNENPEINDVQFAKCTALKTLPAD